MQLTLLTLLTLGGWLVLPLLGLFSCSSTPLEGDALRLIFMTEADPGVSLSGVLVWVDGALVGTSSDGKVETYLRSASTRIVRIRHDCPKGHKDPAEDTILHLRPFEEIGASETPGMEVTLTCLPKEHIAGFVVRANHGPSLPVLLNGVEVAQTNHVGVAHFSRRGEPGTEYIVRLDTSSDSRLVPQHPTRTFTLDDQHQVFVVDQAFELAKASPRKPRPKGRIIRIE